MKISRLHRLYNLSKQNSQGRHKIVAIGLKNGQVRSIGTNKYRQTHPLQANFAIKAGRQNQFFLHAEIEAIRKCPDIDTLIIIRKSKDGNFANATPCPICKLAISHYGISNVYHT